MKELMSNGFANSIAQAIEEMKVEQGDSFSLEHVNLQSWSDEPVFHGESFGD